MNAFPVFIYTYILNMIFLDKRIIKHVPFIQYPVLSLHLQPLRSLRC